MITPIAFQGYATPRFGNEATALKTYAVGNKKYTNIDGVAHNVKKDGTKGAPVPMCTGTGTPLYGS